MESPPLKPKTPKNQQVELDDVQAYQHEIVRLQNALNKAVLDKQRIADANKNLESIIALMPGNIYWKHIDGTFEYCNDHNAKMLNLAHRDDIKGKTNADLLAPEFAEPAEKNDAKVIATGESITIEEVGFDHSTGQKCIYLTKKAPLINREGEVIGVFGLAVDITDRIKMEEELNKARSAAEIASEAKTEFIANMSHDLRTPFSGILGFAHHLYENETHEGKKEELGYIIQSSEKLLSLLNDILQTSKDGTHHQFIETEFNILALIDEVRTLFVAEIERKKLHYQLKSSYLSMQVLADKHRIHRILINLLSNAVKFTEQGTVTVTLDLVKKDGRDALLIEFADTGVGIPECAYQTIFERFTRLSSSYQGKFLGTGIGLWLVGEFINDLSGDISVQSEPGVGSRFTCHIPITLLSCQQREAFGVQQHDDALISHRMNESIEARTCRLRVLMVEDNDITTTMQKRLLESSGYRVDVATSGEQAYERSLQQVYDIIIMDIGLPGISGFAAANQIRRQSTLNAKTPIIGLTAHINQAEQAIWQDSAIDKLILKPLSKTVCQAFSQWVK